MWHRKIVITTFSVLSSKNESFDILKISILYVKSHRRIRQYSQNERYRRTEREGLEQVTRDCRE